MPRVMVSLSRSSIAALLLAISFGCSSPQGGREDISPGTQPTPELSKAVIDERINDAGIYDVPPESGSGGPISWSFDENEPKEIVVVDQQIEGPRATIVLDIKTRSAPRSRTQLYLSGQIRTVWQLKTGWVLRRWEIVDTENISMKYKDLQKTSDQNSNR